MILGKAPLRITLGGGGTDLPFYYRKRGGFFISAAINKYVFVGANHQFYDNISLKYSELETVNNVNDIKHNLFREALKTCGIKNGIEITSLADIPSGTGLGSSSAFLVTLLNVLHNYQNSNYVDKRQLAEESFRIQNIVLKELEGKQDPYICAFGGIKVFEVNKNGFVNVNRLVNEDIVKSNLEKNLFLFFTGKRRTESASNVLKRNKNRMLDCLDKIKMIGLLSRKCFENLDFDGFGRLLDGYWKIKKQYSPDVTDDYLDSVYETALDYGCVGGKIMGAGGGGGFFLFYHPGNVVSQWDFVEKMCVMGLKNMVFSFDENGVNIMSKEDFV